MAKHLYGILREGGPGRWGRVGLGGSEVYAVAEGGLAAAVSESPRLRPDAVPHEELVRLTRSHQAVLEGIAASGTVLPVRFGTAAEDEDGLREILAKGRDGLLGSLEWAEGKVECVVAGLWADLDSQLRKVAEQEALRPSPESLAGLPQARLAQAKLDLGRRLQASLHRRSQKVREEVLDALKTRTGGWRLREVMDDRMILNASFWLSRDSLARFEAGFQAVASRLSPEVELREAGPLPLYSFLTVEVTRVDPLLLAEGRRLLGLGDGATSVELRSRYRALARELHPDRRPGSPEAAASFERMTSAYHALLEHGRQGIRITVSGMDRCPDLK